MPDCRLLFLLLSLPAFAADSPVHRQPIAAAIYPPSLMPGSRVEAEILGEHLDRASAAVPLRPDLRATLQSVSATRVTLAIEAPAGTAPGLYPLRIITPRGASNPVLVRIGGLPHQADAEPNSTAATAQRISIPATVTGRLNTDGDFDFYRFTATRGSRWLLDLHAARLGNGLDAALIVLDHRGRKLAHSEDHFIWDPFLDIEFPDDGEYTVVVQPTHRANDPAFAYALDIRQSAQIDVVSPLAVAPGVQTVTLHGASFQDSKARVAISGAGVSGRLLAANGGAAQVELTISPDAAPGERTIALEGSAGRSNEARFLVDPLPVAGTGELRPPFQLTAMARYREPHRIPLRVREGEALTFEVQAQRLGSEADMALRLLGPDGKQVAANDDFAFSGQAFYQKDPRLHHLIPADGEYTLEVRSLLDVVREGTPFQLTVTPARPAAIPQLAEDRPFLYPGETKKWRVAVQRLDGHRAAIPVRLAGLPEGVTAEPAEIPEGKSEVDIKLSASANALPGQFANVHVEVGGSPAWRNIRVASGGGEGAAFVRVGVATLTIAEKPLFSLEAAVSAVPLPAGAMAEVPVTVRRAEGFSGPIAFRVENLPPGVTAEPVTAGPNSLQATLVLKAAPGAARIRAARVAILGSSSSQEQEAPKIAVLVE